jgi:uncharacterized membrane protein
MTANLVVPLLQSTLIGIVTGMRTMMGPAGVSWAARLGRLDLSGTWLAFLGYAWTPWILALAAVGELIIDQLPLTPSRTVPVQFGARIVMGAVCGAAVGSGRGSLPLGTVAGVLGAVVGTLGGRALRARLATAFGSDRPAAFLEDAIAIGLTLVAALIPR